MLPIANHTPFSVYSRAGTRAPATFSILHPEPWVWTLQVVLKATFSLPGHKPGPANEAIRTENGEQDGAYVESDIAFEKQGADLILCGEAIAPRSAPVREMDLSVQLGELTRRYVVTGERHWLADPRGPQMSAPKPFTRLPLDYRQSFGGSYTLPGIGDIPFGRNPIGKGWAPNMPAIEYQDRPLPNLEYAERRVTSPFDETDPAGLSWYPLTWGLRMMHGLEIQPSGPPKVLPKLWNAAHPDWVLPTYPTGERLRLTGFQASGPLELEVPALPVCLEHNLDGTMQSFPARPDTLCVAPSAGRMFVLARWMIPYKPRAVTRASKVSLTMNSSAKLPPGVSP